MKLASHNSWSYLKPSKWWMRLFRFAARCQDADIKTQYEDYSVRCFDLRVKFSKNGTPIIVHGLTEYKFSPVEICWTLQWLDARKDVAIRVVLDTRSKKKCDSHQKDWFRNYCSFLESCYHNISFWGGECLPEHLLIYKFKYQPTCSEKCASVCSPKIIDDWYPKWFAKRNNKKLKQQGTDFDFLMLDFVNY